MAGGRICARLVLALALIWPAPAPAQNDTFKQLVLDGVEAYRAKNYDLAIEKFEAAYAMRPEPELMYNIARTREKQLRIDEAIAAYEKFLEMPGSTSALRKQALISLESLRAEQALRARGTPANSTAAKATEPPPQPPPQSPPERDHLLEWGLICGGAAALAGGLVFGGLALNKRSQYDSATDPAAKEELRSDAKRDAAIGDVLGAAGLITAAVGVVLLLTAGPSSEAVTIGSPASAPLGIAISGRF